MTSKMSTSWPRDTIYSEAICSPQDVFYVGSDDEDYENENERRRRIDAAGRRFLAGQSPFLLSASLQGPFDRNSGWMNPWATKRQSQGHKSTTLRKGIRSPEQSNTIPRFGTNDKRAAITDSLECQLPSPQSLKQLSASDGHPFLEDEDLQKVQKWRHGIESSQELNTSLEPSSRLATASKPKKRKSDGEGWLKKVSAKRLKALKRSKEQPGVSSRADPVPTAQVQHLTAGSKLSPKPVLQPPREELSFTNGTRITHREPTSQLISPPKQTPSKTERVSACGLGEQPDEENDAVATLSSPVSLHEYRMELEKSRDVPSKEVEIPNRVSAESQPGANLEVHTTPAKCDSRQARNAEEHSSPPDEALQQDELQLDENFVFRADCNTASTEDATSEDAPQDQKIAEQSDGEPEPEPELPSDSPLMNDEAIADMGVTDSTACDTKIDVEMTMESAENEACTNVQVLSTTELQPSAAIDNSAEDAMDTNAEQDSAGLILNNTEMIENCNDPCSDETASVANQDLTAAEIAIQEATQLAQACVDYINNASSQDETQSCVESATSTACPDIKDEGAKFSASSQSSCPPSPLSTIGKSATDSTETSAVSEKYAKKTLEAESCGGTHAAVTGSCLAQSSAEPVTRSVEENIVKEEAVEFSLRTMLQRLVPSSPWSKLSQLTASPAVHVAQEDVGCSNQMMADEDVESLVDGPSPDPSLQLFTESSNQHALLQSPAAGSNSPTYEVQDVNEEAMPSCIPSIEQIEPPAATTEQSMSVSAAGETEQRTCAPEVESQTVPISQQSPWHAELRDTEREQKHEAEPKSSNVAPQTDTSSTSCTSTQSPWAPDPSTPVPRVETAEKDASTDDTPCPRTDEASAPVGHMAAAEQVDCPATARAETPEPQFAFKPFATFMTPSPERFRITKKRLGVRNNLRHPHLRGILACNNYAPSEKRPSKHVTWALDQTEQDSSAANTLISGDSVQDRPASPPPVAPLADLPTSAGTKFSGHFSAVAKRDGVRRSSRLSKEQDRAVSPAQERNGAAVQANGAVDVEMSDAAAVLEIEERRRNREATQSQEPMDMVEDMLGEMGDFWQPWDVETELHEARKANSMAAPELGIGSQNPW